MKKKSPLFEIELGKADYHIHTNYSDAAPSPEEVLEYAQHHTDLDVIAISDHDTIEGALKAQKLHQEGHFRFDLIIGEEITTREGHIVGLFLKAPIKPNLPVRQVLELIRAQKGLAIAPHPFYHSKMKHARYATMDGIGATPLLKNNDLIDAIEIVNATPTLSDENLGASIMNKTILFNAETGSSDAHILEAIGMGYTLFEGKNSQEFRHALLTHQTRAIHKKWSFMGLFKYGFFYFPRGLRLLIHTLIHGRRHRPPDLLEQEIRAKENNPLTNKID